jgi:uncharacterized membrane protein YphA (DoxX/SURF4 family)
VNSRRAAPWLGLALRLVAAGIWLAAGAAKVGSLEQFRVEVEAYKLLPHALVTPFAYALPFVEIAVGVYLLVGLFVRSAAIVGCLLMLTFVAAMGQAYARGLSLDCGCFGTLVHQRVGIGTILRDAALGLPSLLMALFPARFLSLDRSWLGQPDRFAFAGRVPRAPASPDMPPA